MDLHIEKIKKQDVFIHGVDTAQPVIELKLTTQEIRSYRKTLCPNAEAVVDMILADEEVSEECLQESIRESESKLGESI